MTVPAGNNFSISSANNTIVGGTHTIYLCAYALAPASSNINLLDGQSVRIIFARTSTGLWQVQEVGGTGGTVSVSGADGLAAMCETSDATAMKLYYQNSQTAAASAAASRSTWQGAIIGSQATGSSGTYAIAEVIAYNGSHTAAQRASTFRYFAALYGGAFT